MMTDIRTGELGQLADEIDRLRAAAAEADARIARIMARIRDLDTVLASGDDPLVEVPAEIERDALLKRAAREQEQRDTLLARAAQLDQPRQRLEGERDRLVALRTKHQADLDHKLPIEAPLTALRDQTAAFERTFGRTYPQTTERAGQARKLIEISLSELDALRNAINELAPALDRIGGA